MLKVEVQLDGSQTATHCSMTSGIDACEKMNRGYDKCLLYREKLVYDYDAHAYKRCGRCIGAEVKEAERK